MEGLQELSDDELVTRYQCELIRNGMIERLDKIERSLEAMWKKIDGRPSWMVLIVVSFLTTLSGILLTVILR